MGLQMSSIVIMLVGTALAVIFILLLLSSGKYNVMIEPLDNKEYPLCEVYGVGFLLNELFRHNFNTKAERTRKQNLALLYEEKHSEYYLRVNAAQRVTLAYLIILVGFALFGFSNDVLILAIGLAFAVFAWYYVGTLPKEKVDKKTESILNDFADAVSKLALLVNAGSIMREAWEKVAYTGDTELYREMQRVCIDIQNGVSEIDAYSEFGTRCTAPEIKKFVSTIIQGLIKGNAELVEMIKQQSREIWDARRNRVRQEGEKASSKLLVPIMIMFIGIIIIVVVPIFANIGM